MMNKDALTINNLKVIAAFWYDIKLCIIHKTIGIIVVKCAITHKLKSYIGLGYGENETEDIKGILVSGVPFHIKPLIIWLNMIKKEEDAEIV